VIATRLAPCHPDLSQPAFAKTYCLNQYASTIGGSDREPAGFQRVRQNLRDDNDGHTGASDGREQPDNFNLAWALAPNHNPRAIQAGQADGENKCSDERQKRQRIGGRVQAHKPQCELRSDDEQRAGQ